MKMFPIGSLSYTTCVLLPKGVNSNGCQVESCCRSPVGLVYSSDHYVLLCLIHKRTRPAVAVCVHTYMYIHKGSKILVL